MMKIEITRVEYKVLFNEPQIIVFGRDQSGKAHEITINGFRPYCYIPVSNLQSRHVPGVIENNDTYTSIDKNDVRKVFTKTPGGIKKLRDRGFDVYEGDIPFVNRFMIDRGITRGIQVPGNNVLYTDVESWNDLSTNHPYRICMMDIECDDSRGFPRASRDAILCISLHDSFTDTITSLIWRPGAPGAKIDPFGEQNNTLQSRTNDVLDPSRSPRKRKHVVIEYPSERTMLRGLIGYLDTNDPDVISGWNIDNFDIPYLTTRFEMYNLSIGQFSRIKEIEDDKIRGRGIFDLLTGYQRYHTKRQDSYKLADCAQSELGYSKIELPHRINELFTDNPRLLLDYNRRDVELCVDIDNKLGIISFYRELSQYVGIPVERALYPSNLVDTLILRKAFGTVILPTRGTRDNSNFTSFQGANVFDASEGVFEYVCVFDLKSLYPMIMLTLNASYETKDPSGTLMAPDGTRFLKNPPGLMRDIMLNLLEERKYYQHERNKYEHGSEIWERLDRHQDAIKIIMNSYYGVSGFPGFRLFDPDIAAAITSVGRAIIEHTRDVVKSFGYQVLYGDTDSCMIHIPGKTYEEVIVKANFLENEINQSYDDFAKTVLNADEHYFTIRFEKLYSRFFQSGVRKRYAGWLIWDEGVCVDEMDIVGFEIRRSDSSILTRTIQSKIFSMLLKDGDIQTVQEYIRNVIRRYRLGDYSLDCIGIPGGFSKDLDEYDTPGAHVRGAQYSNQYLCTNFGSGDKTKRVYIAFVTGKYPQTDVICFDSDTKIPTEFVVNYERMLNLTVKNPLERIIMSLGLTWSNVDPSITTLFDF